MRQATGVIEVQTRGKGLSDLSGPVGRWVSAQGMRSGLLSLWCQHTSASLTVSENASPEVRSDIERFFERVAPEGDDYEHDIEGPDDMPAHLRSILAGVQLAIPVIDGRPALGTWQAIYLFEHRRRPHARRVALHLIGE